MSEHDPLSHNIHPDDDLFFEIVRQLQRCQDRGIVEFEAWAKELISDPVDANPVPEFIEGDGDEDGDDEADFEYELKAAAEEMNGMWPLTGCRAKVSGRLYIDEEAGRVKFPREWGETRIDEYGEEYFDLEDAVLRSQGVDIHIAYDHINDVVTRVTPIYVFSIADDMTEAGVLYAPIGSLWCHEYDMPTDIETRDRFNEEWPEELEFINRTLKVDADYSLPERLRTLIDHLHDRLEDSDDFRKYTEAYINNTLRLDRDVPYYIIANRTFTLFDGDDMATQEEDDDMWSERSADSPLVLYGALPLIRLREYDDGSIRAYIQIVVYSEDEYNPMEHVRLNVDDISTFRSLRAPRSLAKQAFAAEEVSMQEADNTAE